MTNNIKVVVKTPHHTYADGMMSNTLKSFQSFVGGYIEVVHLPDHPEVLIICNEEGLVNDLPFNVNIGGAYLFGNLVFVGQAGEAFCDCPMTAAEIAEAIEALG